MADTYFFIHVPKTGGRSFEALLANIFPAEITCPSYFEAQCVSPTVDFSRYRFYRGHHSHFLTTALPPNTKVFTFLRHPVARAMSTYEHIRRDKAHYHHQLLIEQGQSLAQFARHLTLGQHISNAQTRILGRSLDFSHLRRTAAFRPEEFPPRAEIFLSVLRSFSTTAEELAMAKERLKNMAFFGLTERFDESCQRFLRLMGRPAGSIPRVNTTAAEVVHRRSQYGADDIAAVTEANALDLELYEFALQRFDSAKSV